MGRDDRRAQLVGAAAAAFLAAGFDATSMEAVAERAGVTRLIVYRHFDSKEALYRAVLDSVVESLRSEFDPVAPSGVAAAPAPPANGTPANGAPLPAEMVAEAAS